MAERKTSGYVTALLSCRFLLLTAGLYKSNLLSITFIIELISNTIAIHPCFFKTSTSSRSNTVLGFSVQRITSVGDVLLHNHYWDGLTLNWTITLLSFGNHFSSFIQKPITNGGRSPRAEFKFTTQLLLRSGNTSWRSAARQVTAAPICPHLTASNEFFCHKPNIPKRKQPQRKKKQTKPKPKRDTSSFFFVRGSQVGMAAWFYAGSPCGHAGVAFT